MVEEGGKGEGGSGCGVWRGGFGVRAAGFGGTPPANPTPVPCPQNTSLQALATYPLKSSKRDPGLRDVPVAFAGVRVSPGDWVYADGDGVLVAPRELKL